MNEKQQLLWSCLEIINLVLSRNQVLSPPNLNLPFTNDLARIVAKKTELRLVALT